MKLNPDEQKVLRYLADEEESYWCFAAIAECVRLDRKAIRRACHSLKRKGLTKFGQGLWDEEGPRGSGYAVTKAGREIRLCALTEQC